ncbi:acetyl/propionyl/methylcrotonyl-CoA carboxylase subunit alpha [Arthrobacter sp. GCM10027362]|uniref:acetyl-CoA carboxylase biotin carboxylase subunit n=1 Tax=Arthrobacter sp. GCM10027362 TaxID=3273379 RepID=UPI003644170A
MTTPVFESLMVTNRGEIARRIIRTANALGIRTIAVCSDVDADLPFVKEASEYVSLGPANPAESYLNVDKLLATAKAVQASAIHPGYGFLAENTDFARRVIESGIVWVGPSPESMEMVADKINARNLMQAAGVPVASGSTEPVGDPDEAVKIANTIGYPVIVKPSGGGGGIGMMVAGSDEDLLAAFATARSRAERFFGDSRILIEQFIQDARHVEVQILGLADGRVIALGERDCSVQRRHQKVAEESPSPGITPGLRARMLDAAVKAGTAVGYRNAGTVECLVDPVRQTFVFLEMNTRLQVEHPVTEAVFSIDLVEEQLRIAAGQDVGFDVVNRQPSGHAIELRIYAEDPKRFLPSPGQISQWTEPSGEGIRVDSGYAAGNTVTTAYDPLLAKLIAWGLNRDEALARARSAVDAFQVAGLKTNLPFFQVLLDDPAFKSGRYSTAIVGELQQRAKAKGETATSKEEYV